MMVPSDLPHPSAVYEKPWGFRSTVYDQNTAQTATHYKPEWEGVMYDYVFQASGCHSVMSDGGCLLKDTPSTHQTPYDQVPNL